MRRGQSVRVGQDVHVRAWLAAVHRRRTCKFAPSFGADVSGVEAWAGEVDQVLTGGQLKDLLVQSAPNARPRPGRAE